MIIIQINPLFDFLIFLLLELPQILTLIVIWLVLIAAYLVLRRVIRRKTRGAGAQPTVISGLMLALGLIFLYISFIAIFVVFPEYSVNLAILIGTSSLIIGAAIGLAIGTAVQNIVSGIYVIFTQPFRIGDLVRISDLEGIVTEINMNYTTILEMTSGNEVMMPNNDILSSKIRNFRFPKEDFEQHQAEIEAGGRELVQLIKDAQKEEPILRYTFNLIFTPENRDPRNLRVAFDTTCKRWTKRFGFRPLHSIEYSGGPDNQLRYQFTIYTKEARIIYENRSKFIDDLLDSAAQFVEKAK